MVGAIIRLYREGHRISPAMLVAAIPASADTEGRTRAQLVASVTAMGMLMPLSAAMSPSSRIAGLAASYLHKPKS